MDTPEQSRPAPPPPAPPLPRDGAPPFQFSLKWLLIGVTAVAVLLALVTVADQFLLGWVLEPVVTLVLPTSLLVAAIFGHGGVRAFSVGALVPSYHVLSTGRAPVWTVGAWLGDTLWLLVWCVLCGIVAVAVRRWIVRHG